MAPRKQLWHPDEVKDFYVYRIFCGFETVYIGKGSGSRLKRQKIKFGLDGDILERFNNEDSCFKAERRWIKLLKPTENKSFGGEGGRKLNPPMYNTRERKEYIRFFNEMNKIGPRKWVSQYLLRKVNESNAELYGMSKAELFRLREISVGAWC